MKPLSAICTVCGILLTPGVRAEGVAAAAPAAQSTLTCQFNSGPKTGYIQDFRGTNATPAVVGGPCRDALGSYGIAIPDRPQQSTLTCQYFSGPKAGQVQDFRGTNATPAVVGGACTDGQGSLGLGIPNREVPDKAAPQTVTVICRAPELSPTATFSYRLDYVHNTVTDPGGRVLPVQMSDQEITWDDNGPDGTVKNSLQRYSGQLTQVKSNQSFSFSCQPE
jgi:hypothetical protein